MPALGRHTGMVYTALLGLLSMAGGQAANLTASVFDSDLMRDWGNGTRFVEVSLTPGAGGLEKAHVFWMADGDRLGLRMASSALFIAPDDAQVRADLKASLMRQRATFDLENLPATGPMSSPGQGDIFRYNNSGVAVDVGVDGSGKLSKGAVDYAKALADKALAIGVRFKKGEAASPRSVEGRGAAIVPCDEALGLREVLSFRRHLGEDGSPMGGTPNATFTSWVFRGASQTPAIEVHMIRCDDEGLAKAMETKWAQRENLASYGVRVDRADVGATYVDKFSWAFFGRSGRQLVLARYRFDEKGPAGTQAGFSAEAQKYLSLH